jgi:hypothetical protein
MTQRLGGVSASSETSSESRSRHQHLDGHLDYLASLNMNP